MASIPTTYPRDFDEARAYVASGPAGDRQNSRHLSGASTRVDRLAGSPGSPSAYAVRYHETDVVIFYETGEILLRTDGFISPMTARKMSACLGPDRWVGNVGNYRYNDAPASVRQARRQRAADHMVFQDQTRKGYPVTVKFVRTLLISRDGQGRTTYQADDGIVIY